MKPEVPRLLWNKPRLFPNNDIKVKNKLDSHILYLEWFRNRAVLPLGEEIEFQVLEEKTFPIIMSKNKVVRKAPEFSGQNNLLNVISADGMPSLMKSMVIRICDFPFTARLVIASRTFLVENPCKIVTTNLSGAVDLSFYDPRKFLLYYNGWASYKEIWHF